MTSHEHLDLLRAQLERRVPELAVHLAPGAQLLEARLRGRPGLHIAWDYAAAAYRWVDGPDAGGRVGGDAIQAADQIERALL